MGVVEGKGICPPCVSVQDYPHPGYSPALTCKAAIRNVLSSQLHRLRAVSLDIGRLGHTTTYSYHDFHESYLRRDSSPRLPVWSARTHGEGVSVVGGYQWMMNRRASAGG